MPSGFSWARLSGMARAKMKLSTLTEHYPTFTESWGYFCIAQFCRFWEDLLTQIVASGLNWCCAVFGSWGWEKVVLVLWFMFVLFSMLHWLELISSSRRLLQMPGQRQLVLNQSQLLQLNSVFLACICLPLASRCFFFFPSVFYFIMWRITDTVIPDMSILSIK